MRATDPNGSVPHVGEDEDSEHPGRSRKKKDIAYSSFEGLVLAIGVVTVIGSLFFYYLTAHMIEEMVAQVLLLAVLLGAVRWGRSGGFVAAALASLVYVVMRVPLIVESQGLDFDVASLIAIRVAAYGFVGIGVGKLCERIRYVIDGFERTSGLDEWSRVYNQRFVTRSLDAAAGRFTRYRTPHSVVILEIARGITVSLRPSRHRMLVRGVADKIRDEVRAVDEIGRLDDGRFLVLLTNTERDGAFLVAKRLAEGVRDILGAGRESVSTLVLSTPDDVERLAELASRLRKETDHSSSGS